MPGELEAALTTTESDAVATVRAADQAARAAKRLAAAAKLGDLGALDKAIAEVDATVQTLRLRANTTRDAWQFDAATYAQEGRLLEEIRQAAIEAGLSVHEEEGRLFSYPVLLRVQGRSGAEVAVSIDRKRVKGLRPSQLVQRLLTERSKPPKFDSRAFLEALYKAYQWAIKDARPQPALSTMGPSIELIRLYELLTLFPGHARDYSRQEFTRDIYLLDRSGRTTTNSGARMELSASTGTRNRSRVLELVDEHGRAQVYYAIAFTRT